MRHNRGQNLLEYVFLVALLVAATIAMQVYIKRGIQGNFRAGAKQLSASPYVKGQATSTSTTQSFSSEIEYSALEDPIAVKSPRDAISYEEAVSNSQATSPIGVGAVATKDTQTSSMTNREGTELTDYEYINP